MAATKNTAAPANSLAPASSQALAVLRHPDRSSCSWVVVLAATLETPLLDLRENLRRLHTEVPLTGARLHGEQWIAGAPASPILAPGDVLTCPALVAPFDLGAQPPVRIVVDAARSQLAVAAHHAAFDGTSIVALLNALLGEEIVPVNEGHARPNAPQPMLSLAGASRLVTQRIGQFLRPVHRVAGSSATPTAELLFERDVSAARRIDTATLAAACVQASAAHNVRTGKRFSRVGLSLGVAGASGVGNLASYRRIDVTAGDDVAECVRAALRTRNSPLELQFLPRPARFLGSLAARLSDSLLVSNLGRVSVPRVTKINFFPVARGRSAVAFGSVGLAGGPSTLSLRSLHLRPSDATALLDDAVHQLLDASTRLAQDG